MSGRDIFRLIVCAIGMASIGFGLPAIIGGILSSIGFPLRNGITPLQEFGGALASLLSGGIILFGANLIVRLIYGAEK